MRIAHLSSEVAPFAKTGGLGDVVGALPKYQAALGHDVQVYMPLHRDVWKTLSKLGSQPELATEPFRVQAGSTVYDVGVLRTTIPDSNVPLFLIGQNELFDRPNIYSPDYFQRDDGITRFSVFVRAALATMERLWLTPDILNAHDWHAALAPMALRFDEPRNWVFARTKTILTIHNLAYQGVYAPQTFANLGLPASVSSQVEFDGAVNLMKGGIVAADAITTVSPNFGREIMSPKGGFGLDGMLRMRSDSFAGILNGIDTDVWSPSKDNRIPVHYDASSIEKKRDNKRSLLERVGMDPNDGGFVIGAIGRLTEQKGYDTFFPIIGELLNAGIRVVFLGSGEKELEQKVAQFSYHGEGRFWGYVGYHEDLAHLIEAGIDAFVMPSRFEPCGLNQMYSLAYGTPPIVHMVGGLADTVEPYNGRNRESATGFGYYEPTASALRDTIFWARECYRDARLWTEIAQNGMAKDFSWWRSAEKYLQVYEAVLAR